MAARVRRADRRTPGPGDYQGAAPGEVAPHLQKGASFGGPLNRCDRFAEGAREIVNPRSPGPGSAWSSDVPSTIYSSTAAGSPKIGTARRFMCDAKIEGVGGVCSLAEASVASQKSFYEVDHQRPGPGAYRPRRPRLVTGKQLVATPPPRRARRPLTNRGDAAAATRIVL